MSRVCVCVCRAFAVARVWMGDDGIDASRRAWISHRSMRFDAIRFDSIDAMVSFAVVVVVVVDDDDDDAFVRAGGARGRRTESARSIDRSVDRTIGRYARGWIK